MENIESILKGAGVELSAEQLETVNKSVMENYKTIADYNKQKDKVQNLTEQLTATKESLKAFDGVDVDSFNKQISDLNAALEQKDKEFAAENAERDFRDTIADAIRAAKGKDANVIMKLLDLDTLRDSQNQQTDIADAIRALADNDLTKGMFEVDEPKHEPAQRMSPIGLVNNRAVASNYLDEKYKNNPYYHAK